MKTIQLTKVMAVLSALVMIISCVNDDDFDIPVLDQGIQAPDGNVISIGALGAALEQAILDGENSLTFEDSNSYVEGYVISSDQSGNWFEEIIIQDAPSNPTTGVRVLIDESPLFTTYEIGQKIFVKLDGLTAAIGNGTLSLGFLEGNFLESIPAPQQFEFIQRSPEVQEIVPLEISISDFSDALENTFVRLTDVQFIPEEVLDASLTFAGEALDEFDGERTLIACDGNLTAILSTSTFADFKSVALPAGRGSVSGILTRNFFGDIFNIVINDLSGIAFEDVERCDPVEIDCGIAASAGSQVLFEDDFETQGTNTPISGNGWTNFIEAGTETWEAFTSGGTNASLGISARVGSFLSGDAATIAWLVTPEINFDAQDGETFEFMTSNSFSDGSTLELLFSSDWDGVPENIPTATWDVLPAATIVQDGDFFGDWIDSGIVDLSCVTGTGYIGFRYTGSGDEGFDGTYELDEIQINAN